MPNEIKVGDWVVFDLRVGQIKEIDGGYGTFSDGSFETHGRILDKCRPLTLRNKNITEFFGYYYKELRQIDGEIGFNYPDIQQYFWHLALNAIDCVQNGPYFDSAKEFVRDAKEYKKVIQGVNLFRRKLG